MTSFIYQLWKLALYNQISWIWYDMKDLTWEGVFVVIEDLTQACLAYFHFSTAILMNSIYIYHMTLIWNHAFWWENAKILPHTHNLVMAFIT